MITLPDGSDWFRCRADGGFSGNHAVFRPHRPLAKGTIPRRDPIVAPDVALAEARKVRRAIKALIDADLESLRPVELWKLGGELEAMGGRLEALRGLIRRVRKPSREIDALKPVLPDWERCLRRRGDELAAFCADQLGEALVEEVQP